MTCVTAFLVAAWAFLACICVLWVTARAQEALQGVDGYSMRCTARLYVLGCCSLRGQNTVLINCSTSSTVRRTRWGQSLILRATRKASNMQTCTVARAATNCHCEPWCLLLRCLPSLLCSLLCCSPVLQSLGAFHEATLLLCWLHFLHTRVHTVPTINAIVKSRACHSCTSRQNIW